jgi:outer membrane protein assembly factor BamA
MQQSFDIATFVKTIRRYGIGLCLLWLLTSCQPTKYLAEDELLYDGARIDLLQPDSIRQEALLKKQLLRYAQPKKNSKTQLGIYNTFHRPKKEKGLFNWIADRLGQPTRIFSMADLTRSRALMENYLQDNGYFNSQVSSDTSRLSGKRVRVRYRINSHGRYDIGRVQFLRDTNTAIQKLLQTQAEKSLIRPGKAYQLSALKAERSRLTGIARNQGYYTFRPDYVYYFVDTLPRSKKADIYLRINEPESLGRYYIDTPLVYPTYQLDQLEVSNSAALDTLTYKDLKIIQTQTYVKPAPLERIITQSASALYSEKLQDQTINHLLDLGVFKFVNVKYEEHIRRDTTFLRPLIYLTPALTQNVNAELEASTETTNFLGSALRGSYTHRNLFKGAERLNISLSAGVETQINNPQLPFINTLELSAQASLEFPGFLIPFRKQKSYTYYVPRTKVSLSNDYQDRTGFFTINAFRAEFGYQWQENRYRKHSFQPLSMNLVRLLNTSADFEAILDQNARLRQSFDNIAILSMLYRFTYNEQEINTLKNYFYFQGTIESSGNVADLLAGRDGQLFGTQFSQFLKLDADLRYTILKPTQSWVGRLALGLGYSYNNSNVMPYTKQYFVGGANSIRAFQLRGLGPGGVAPDSTLSSNFFDQTGDIKIEANLEYRFDLLPYTEGALFTDVGNVFFLRNSENEERFQEAVFRWDRFYQQLAVGAGVGLRLDLDFVLLRFDVAIPLQQPSRPSGQRWVLDEIAFAKKSWRQDNIAYNLAIGYPF